MRQRFNPQPGLDIIPIEKVLLPTRSRDDLPPILAGLQWIWIHPELKAQIFTLLEDKILAGKKATGRTGLDLWQILVLGVVRLGLDTNFDRLEHLANKDMLCCGNEGVSPGSVPHIRMFCSLDFRSFRSFGISQIFRLN